METALHWHKEKFFANATQTFVSKYGKNEKQKIHRRKNFFSNETQIFVR